MIHLKKMTSCRLLGRNQEVNICLVSVPHANLFVALIQILQFFSEQIIYSAVCYISFILIMNDEEYERDRERKNSYCN